MCKGRIKVLRDKHCLFHCLISHFIFSITRNYYSLFFKHKRKASPLEKRKESEPPFLEYRWFNYWKLFFTILFSSLSHASHYLLRQFFQNIDTCIKGCILNVEIDRFILFVNKRPCRERVDADGGNQGCYDSKRAFASNDIHNQIK